MIPDLIATRLALRSGRSDAAAEMARAIEAAESAAGAPAFLSTDFDAARRAAAASEPQQPLAGLAVSVKDLFDVAGQTTAAGSIVLAGAPAATEDSAAVARLRAAGAALIGRTHMVEFAFSGVGTNPHFPTPAAWDALAGAPAAEAGQAPVPRIPGGSSSGAAVSVATGAAFVGLGSDTGGSIRIPAALNGLVGFKSTARLVPTDGALPLSTTLDTVCALTRSVRDALLAHEILAARRVTRSPVPLSGYRLAVPQTTMLDGLESGVAQAFERALQRLRDAGAQVVDIPLPELGELAALQAGGGFTAAESYAWHRSLLASRGKDYDPRVASRIQRGAAMLACDYLDLQRLRRQWIGRVEQALQGFDAALSPTISLVAPPIAELAPADGRDPAQDAARDEAFFRVNALLLRNTSVVNLLDGCAISLPMHLPGELPTGLMLWQGALRDDTLLNLALLAEPELQKP
ncbi:amidase [Ramlibacter sp. 2FC]|uniref:amidase n=1 Tax=Ramlibacter sp. 2FC TaxID=2502188 RepID=UPI0010F50E88|nr:amidase [Ramlibacter sp. 2FC]